MTVYENQETVVGAPYAVPSSELARVTLDFVRGTLERAADTTRLAAYVMRELRSLIGARAALLIQAPDGYESTGIQVLGVTPKRRRHDIADKILESVLERTRLTEGVQVWHRDKADPETIAMLARLRSEAAVSAPLWADSEFLGIILLAGVPPDGLELASESLSILAPLTALALRNALMHMHQEKIIKERTKKLQRQEEDRQALEKQRQQEQRLLSLGVLADGVGHEINNPLFGIMNYAQLLLDACGDEPSETKVFAGEILTEANRIVAVTRSLRSLTDKKRGEKTAVEIPKLIEDMLTLNRASFEDDHIDLKIEVEVAPTLPSSMCHPADILYVLLALVANAREALNRKYAGKHSDKILSITVQQGGEGDATTVRTLIRDHGDGLAPEALDTVFDPFFTTKNRTQGMGMSLATSLAIVQGHGGNLTVASEQGVFTEFCLELPTLE